MRVAAVVASLFATVRGQSISSCGGAHDHLQNLKVVITPDPIEKGKSFTLDITGTMDEDFAGGTADVDLNVKVFSIIDKQVKSTGGFNFSPAIVPKGDAHVVVGPVSLPSIPLPGSITVSGKVALKNTVGEPILCLNLDLDVPAVDDDRVLDPALGVSADPVPTCTQASDHMKNFVVEHDKDKHTTDISGSLDEDVTSVTVKADLKVHIGFLPIPISVQAPVSFKPGLKKGDLKWLFTSDQEPPPPKVKVDGQVTLSDDKGEEIVCFKVLPPSDSEVIANTPDDPNGVACELCEKAVAAGVNRGTVACENACSKLGPVEGICRKACDSIGEVCQKLAHEDCPEAVCTKVKLCSTSGSVVV